MKAVSVKRYIDKMMELSLRVILSFKADLTSALAVEAK
jgi:hypothetical protein